MSVMIQLPLDIPDVKVLSTECRPDGALLIKVESTRQGACCSRCGRDIHHFHGDDRPLQVRHLPILEWRVYLEIRPKRYRCPPCEGRPTTTQRCDWYEPNSPQTKAFEKGVLRSGEQHGSGGKPEAGAGTRRGRGDPGALGVDDGGLEPVYDPGDTGH